MNQSLNVFKHYKYNIYDKTNFMLGFPACNYAVIRYRDFFHFML